MTNCYNVGKVNGTSSVGGIVGATIAVSGNIVGITGCYYLTDAAAAGIGSNGDVAGCAEAKTAEQFASGEVAYALQQGIKNDTDNETGGTGNDYKVDIPVIDTINGTTAATAIDTTIGMPTIAIDPQI